MKVKHKKDNVYVCKEKFITEKDDKTILEGDYFYYNKNTIKNVSNGCEYKINKSELNNFFKSVKNKVVNKSMLDISPTMFILNSTSIVAILFFSIFLAYIKNYYLLGISSIIMLEMLYYSYLFIVKKEHEIIEISFEDVCINKLFMLPFSIILAIIFTLIIDNYKQIIINITKALQYLDDLIYIIGFMLLIIGGVYAFIKLNHLGSKLFLTKRGKGK